MIAFMIISLVQMNNRMMRDVISILNSGVEIIWDCIVDTSKELYSVFKTSDVHNDNKRIENSSNEYSSNEYGYDMGGNYIHSDYDPMIEPKYDHHSHIPRCNDGDVYHTGPDGLYKIDEMNEYNIKDLIFICPLP